MQSDEFREIMRKAKLKSTRWAVLIFFEEYEERFPWLPDYRDIMEGTGISSTSHMNSCLEPMREAGLIGGKILETGHTAPRTLHLTDLGREVLAYFHAAISEEIDNGEE